MSTKQVAQQLVQGLLHLFYPRVCWVCQRLQSLEQPAICASCAETLVRDPYATCPRCSSTVGPFIALADGCPACKDTNLAFDRAFRMGPYEGLLRGVVLRMKQHQGEGLTEIVGALWARQVASRLATVAPDVIVPVPLHWLRYWQRGFNQSEVLARCLALELGIPCRPGWLRRVRRTARQAVQKPAKRWDNVKGAFTLGRRVEVTGKSVLLVDDVLTTGATISEAARVLRPGKPRLITAVVIGHGR